MLCSLAAYVRDVGPTFFVVKINVGALSLRRASNMLANNVVLFSTICGAMRDWHCLLHG